jgi:hypothetical protein
MTEISIVLRLPKRQGGTHRFQTTEEIAHRWQLLTKGQQIGLYDQAARNHEDLPVLLERLFKERRL